MPSPSSTIWLSREERRALARERREPAATSSTTTRSCLFCYAPLANGSPVCSEACDDGWWAIVPTRDGELYEPDRLPRGRGQRRN